MNRSRTEFRGGEDSSLNERVVEKRFEYYNKRRNQALSIIQMRMIQQKKLSNAMKSKDTVSNTKPIYQSTTGPYLGWPAMVPQSRTNTAYQSRRPTSRGTPNNIQTRIQSSESLAPNGRKELLMSKHSSQAMNRYQNIVGKASAYLSPPRMGS